MQTVAEVMSRTVHSVAPWDPVADTLRMMQRRGITHVLVLEEGALVGVACECDLVAAPANEPVSAVMSRPVRTVSPGFAVGAAAELMRMCELSCLPVVDGQELVGVITRSDLAAIGQGFRLLTPEYRCSACGSRHHVRGDHRTELPLCLECAERAHAPEDALEQGTVD